MVSAERVRGTDRAPREVMSGFRYKGLGQVLKERRRITVREHRCTMDLQRMEHIGGT